MAVEKLIAVDGINGMTYIGKDVNPPLEKIAEDLFWGKRELIEDYCVVQTSTLSSTKEDSYEDRARKAYQDTKHIEGKAINLPHRNIQTVHNLNEL